MTDLNAKTKKTARTLAYGLLAGVVLNAINEHAPQVFDLPAKAARQVADLFSGSTPEERFAESQARAEATLLRITTDPAALVAIVAEEKLAERGETFGPDHEDLMGRIHEMALDAAIRHADRDVEDIRALKEQGVRLAQSGMTGEQFDAWASEITMFEANAFDEIQAVAAELEAAGVGGKDGASFTLEYTLSPTGYSPTALKTLFTNPEMTQALHDASDRLEETVVSKIARINAGKDGDFSWVPERSAALALD